MVLNIPNALFRTEQLFAPSPEDGEVLARFGLRDIYSLDQYTTRTGLTSPGTVTERDPLGSGQAWTNMANATASDNAYATATISSSAYIRLWDVVLVSTVSQISNHKQSTKEIGTDDELMNLGSSSDLWGATTLTPTLINNSGFGVEIAYINLATYTKQLNCTNFGFSVPTWAEIKGIKVRIEHSISGNDIQVDHVQMEVYYY